MSDYPEFDLKTFDVSVMQSLKKYILLDASEESKKVMKEVKYSRDGLNTTQGEPLKLISSISVIMEADRC